MARSQLSVMPDKDTGDNIAVGHKRTNQMNIAHLILLLTLHFYTQAENGNNGGDTARPSKGQSLAPPSTKEICKNIDFKGSAGPTSGKKGAVKIQNKMKSKSTCSAQVHKDFADLLQGDFGSCMAEKLAQGSSEKPVIEHSGFFADRNVNHNPKGKKSCHAFGLAVDIAKIGSTEMKGKEKQRKYVEGIKECCKKGRSFGGRVSDGWKNIVGMATRRRGEKVGGCKIIWADNARASAKAKANTKADIAHEDHIHLEIQPKCNECRKNPKKCEGQ